MARVIVRFLLTLALVPASGFLTALWVMMVQLVIGWGRFADRLASVGFLVIPWVILGAYWLIWSGLVHWTQRRKLATAGVIGAGWCAAAFAVAVIELLYLGGSSELEPASAFISLGMPLACLIVITWLWQETPEERQGRVHRAELGARACPKCRYDMSAMMTLNCPECGTTYTLASLLESHAQKQVPEALP